MRLYFSCIVLGGILMLGLSSTVSCTPAPAPITQMTIPSATQIPAPAIISTPAPNPSTQMPIPSPTQVTGPTIISTPAPTAVPQLPGVKVNGLGFTVGDKPFRFIGANAPNFGFYREYGFSIEEAIKSAKENGISVLRIYLGYNNGPWGGKPFEEYDKVLDFAAKNGVYVIATINDGCCHSGSETREAYLARFPYVNMTSESELADFQGFIQSLLLRKNTANGRIYRDDPTILAWDVMNEPAVELFTDAELNSWLGKVTTYVKTLDPNHLVTIGINTSPGIYSTSGAHYKALDMPGLDFFSIHYNLPYSPAVASNLDSIRYRVETLRSLGKPVVMEEFGVGSERIFPGDVSPSTLNDWLQAYKDQLDSAFSAGASGALFWGWGVPETKKVLLWWRIEDHDSSETEFTKLIRGYQMPPALPAPDSAKTIVTPQPTLAIPQDKYILAFCTLIGQDKQILVAPGTPVVIMWGWKASTAEQLQDYLDNDITTVKLDGKIISAQAPYNITSNSLGDYSLHWYTQIGTPSTGSHKLVYDESWKAMISDGTDTYGPGSPHPTQHDECDLIVQ